MINEFKPGNILEEKLAALYRKEIRVSEFLEMLLESQVIILADRDIDISRPDMHFNPLVLTSPMGYNVLATFSSIELARPAAARYPAYSFAVAVDTPWFLTGAYDNVGFALNPGWPVGFELSPDGLQKYLVQYGIIKPHQQN